MTVALLKHGRALRAAVDSKAVADPGASWAQAHDLRSVIRLSLSSI
jgi:hypothetical protein